MKYEDFLEGKQGDIREAVARIAVLPGLTREDVERLHDQWAVIAIPTAAVHAKAKDNQRTGEFDTIGLFLSMFAPVIEEGMRKISLPLFLKDPPAAVASLMHETDELMAGLYVEHPATAAEMGRLLALLHPASNVLVDEEAPLDLLSYV